MNTAGFWIGQHPDPDRIVMTPAQIAAMNVQTMRTESSLEDIVNFDASLSGLKLKAEILHSLKWTRYGGFFLDTGRKPDAAWWDRLEKNLNLDAITSEVSVRFGMISALCDQRALPLTEGLYRENLNLNFDRLQYNTLDIALPVAILHESRDGQWFYVASTSTRGWVRSAYVGLCSREAMRSYSMVSRIAVITSAKADIFTDENLRIYHGRVPMGAKLPVLGPNDSFKVRVAVPRRNPDGTGTMMSAYVLTRDLHIGFLPYTARTIIDQAFKLLHTPYGWGGQFGEQDCSRYLQQIFSCVGLILPRNSTQQSHIGRPIYKNDKKGMNAEKRTVLKELAIPALTLLRPSGHIMLFLGWVDDTPYVIHSLWGYNHGKDTMIVVNRIAVTRIDLGDGPSGSYLDRINTMRVLDGPATFKEKSLRRSR
jgi:hypothetical protein